MSSKAIISRVISISLVLLLCTLAACDTSAGTSLSGQSTSSIEPQGPVVIESSFPDGAPPLNQTAELLYTIKIFSHDIKNITFTINLPDAFQLENGDLSWSGDLDEGEVKEISVLIKAVQTGNYEIEMTTYCNPEENGGYGGTGHFPIYVAVSEDSAEWGTFPPWRPKNGNPTPVVPADHK